MTLNTGTVGVVTTTEAIAVQSRKVMSALGDQETRPRMIVRHMSFLRIPFESGLLIRSVETLFENRGERSGRRGKTHLQKEEIEHKE